MWQTSFFDHARLEVEDQVCLIGDSSRLGTLV